MNLDPFNEFKYLAIRQEKQFEYLKAHRHLIDSRISDEDIMMIFDKGIDAVSFCAEEVRKHDRLTLENSLRVYDDLPPKLQDM